MTADQVVIDGVFCDCVMSEPQVKGTRWCFATVTLPDGRQVKGVLHPDPQRARQSAWFSAKRVWDSTKARSL